MGAWAVLIFLPFAASLALLLLLVWGEVVEWWRERHAPPGEVVYVNFRRDEEEAA